MRTVAAALVLTALTCPLTARAGLVLEFIQVTSLDAPPATGPALTSAPPMSVGDTLFFQVAMRDTTGSTLAWSANGDDGNAGGPGSLALFAFGVRFEGTPGVAVNPAPANPTNVRVVDPTSFVQLTNFSNAPVFTNVFGLGTLGGPFLTVPDPGNQYRIPLFNMRVVAVGPGTASFRLRDPNPAPTHEDNAVMLDWDPSLSPNPGYAVPIDYLLFGTGFTNSYELPITVTPEPSALALAGLTAAAWIGRSAARCRRARRG